MSSTICSFSASTNATFVRPMLLRIFFPKILPASVSYWCTLSSFLNVHYLVELGEFYDFHFVSWLRTIKKAARVTFVKHKSLTVLKGCVFYLLILFICGLFDKNFPGNVITLSEEDTVWIMINTNHCTETFIILTACIKSQTISKVSRHIAPLHNPKYIGYFIIPDMSKHNLECVFRVWWYTLYCQETIISRDDGNRPKYSCSLFDFKTRRIQESHQYS